jgi:mannosyltransferase OCH1-like enzyme
MVMIPMTFHFAFFRGATDWPWLDFHTLCLKSCKVRSGAIKIVVHYDRDGSGVAWDAAKDISGIEWRQTELSWAINGQPITDQRIMADYHRLQVLHTEGGFYCDLDFIFLKEFNPLRHYPAVIGVQCKQKMKLACGLIGAIPGSTFIKAYIDSYKDWTPSEEKKVWTFANVIPWKLSQEYPVQVIPRSAFYPVAWSNKTFWQGQAVPIKNAYAIHLWETLHPELSVEILMKTCLAAEIAKITGEPVKPAVVQVREGLLSFD